MGRGRAKAKQTKVARELKYRSVDTDFSSLERELRASSGEEGEIPDQYADIAAQYGYETDDEDDDDFDDADEFDDEDDDDADGDADGPGDDAKGTADAVDDDSGKH